jgi:hypothetical protein
MLKEGGKSARPSGISATVTIRAPALASEANAVHTVTAHKSGITVVEW